MKIFKYICAFAVLMISLSSCYEEESFVEENSTSTGEYSPVIQSVDPQGDYTAGSGLSVVVHYWSEGTIDYHELYSAVGSEADAALYSTTDYVNNYDSEAGSEVVNLDYTIPSDVVAGDTVFLTVTTYNENARSASRTAQVIIEE